MKKRRRANRSSSPRDIDVKSFWGLDDSGAVPPPPEGPPPQIRPTSDPGAVPRSLGDPPLPARPGAAGAHLAAAYEEAVRAATALAAVNGLLAPAPDDTDEGDGA